MKKPLVQLTVWGLSKFPKHEANKYFNGISFQYMIHDHFVVRSCLLAGGSLNHYVGWVLVHNGRHIYWSRAPCKLGKSHSTLGWKSVDFNTSWDVCQLTWLLVHWYFADTSQRISWLSVARKAPAPSDLSFDISADIAFESPSIHCLWHLSVYVNFSLVTNHTDTFEKILKFINVCISALITWFRVIIGIN